MTQIGTDSEVGLAERAYVSLRDAILAHELRPGTRLSVPVVAERLGISRSPAREAIARIAHEGLASVTPNRGAIVADLAEDDLVEIYQLREVLEGLACRLAAPLLTDADADRLDSLVTQHASAVEANDVERHYEVDSAFHSAIRDVAANSRLSSSLDLLQGQVRLGMYRTHRSPGGMQQALSEHRLILASLRLGDAEVAEAAGRAHIARLLRDLRTVPEPVAT
ncbi:GntR family transcriptional regulator [Solicola gregarius]|uniref:GntR family transcriptional regulator n=1 Tax=Solicola gregarius TaxID=2908642 RepID=A0AA46TGB7_9ACTN|nr:GntR family transcriptional regulator [Solicola gregarius]UYM04668.1 GntR family transcriptional regulator [Solicola gregarius]